jgi:hypothetical protein
MCHEAPQRAVHVGLGVWQRLSDRQPCACKRRMWTQHLSWLVACPQLLQKPTGAGAGLNRVTALSAPDQPRSLQGPSGPKRNASSLFTARC